MIKKIISSAESETEQAALDAAIEAGIKYGGWTNQSSSYNLKQSTLKTDRRIEQNLFESDGTAIFYMGKMDYRCELSRKIANRHGYPCAHYDLAANEDPKQLATDLRTWAAINNVRKLHLVGPKTSADPQVSAVVKTVISDAVSPFFDFFIEASKEHRKEEKEYD